MKRAMFLLLAVLILSPHANAQGDSSFQVIFNGGYSLPQKPDVFKDAWNNGYNLGGGVGYRLGRLMFQGLVNYDRFSIDVDGVMNVLTEEIGFDPTMLGLDINIQGGDVSVLSLTGEVKVAFVEGSGPVNPYVIGGGGIGRLSTDDVTVSLELFGERLEETVESESETKPMATLGGGVDIPIGERAAVFAEGRYQWVFTSDESMGFVTIRGGVRVGL
jgi:opacity protein-like surface antigen